jgi:hypothetical protein
MFCLGTGRQVVMVAVNQSSLARYRCQDQNHGNLALGEIHPYRPSQPETIRLIGRMLATAIFGARNAATR